MTDYNDGKWHGFNGGECPVHPQSIVDILDKDIGKRTETQAGVWEWPVIRGAFRVVRPYREPRVIWVNEYSSGALAPHADEQTAKLFAAQGTLPALRIAVRYVEQPE